MNNKKAQSGFILRVFSIIAYMIVLAVVVMLLQVPACNSGEKLQESVHSYSPEILQLNAEEQLVSYLRTPIPPDIMERIAWVDQNYETGLFLGQWGGREYLKWDGIPNKQKLDSARNFLNSNPEVYVDRSYEEFLVALHPHKNSDAFDVVTKLTFLQKIDETRGILPPKERYFSPRICVEYFYGNECLRDVIYIVDHADPRDQQDSIWYYDIEYPDGRAYIANATLPLPDATLTKVFLDYPAEKIYVRLPEV